MLRKFSDLVGQTITKINITTGDRDSKIIFQLANGDTYWLFFEASELDEEVYITDI